MRRIVSLLTVLLVSVGFAAPAFAGTGAVQAKWNVAVLLSASVVPNYTTGYGPTGGSGSGSTPAVGPLASPGAGWVDFGTVVAGYSYLYKYAAQVNVNTNDSNGFSVYAEGSTDLNGNTTGAYPISSVLYWLVSSSANSPFSASTAFQKTAGTPYNANQNITYAGTPPASALVWASPSGGTVSRGFDYQIRLPGSIPIDKFNVYVVYTVVAN